MKSFNLRAIAKAACLAMAGGILIWVSVLLLGVHSPAPANAATPTALELADKMLIGASGLEDEGPYRLIDPVGPGGLTRSAAVDEVVASTMKGGNYTPNQNYFGTYGPQFYMPAEPIGNDDARYRAPHAHVPNSGGWPSSTGEGGHR